MSTKGEIIIELEAAKLGKSLQYISEAAVNAIQNAVRDLAHATFAEIVSKAQSSLHTTRLDYLKGLRFDIIGPNEYFIHLDGKIPNDIENGWAPYSNKENLLKSTKRVSIGKRAGQPWVQKAKDGSRYAFVPFERKLSTPIKGASDLAGLLGGIKMKNAAGNMQKLTSIFKDVNGSPINGQVAVVKNLGDSIFNNLVKYQSVTKGEDGKVSIKSTYMNYRTVSDKGNSRWMNKGYGGLKAFDAAEAHVRQEVQNILQTILR